MPSTVELTAILTDAPILVDADGNTTVSPGPDVAADIAAAVAPFIHPRFLDRRGIVERLIDADQPVLPAGSHQMTLREARATLAHIERWELDRRAALDDVQRTEYVDAGNVAGQFDRLLALAQQGVVVQVLRYGEPVAHLVPAGR